MLTERILLVILLLRIVAVNSLSFYLTSTKIATHWISSGTIQTETVHGSDFAASSLCAAKSWCQAFCETGPLTYVLLSLISAAFNDDPNEQTKFDCFTKRSRFNIFTAQANIDITFSSSVYTGHNMVLANLQDGVTDLKLGSGFMINPASILYMVFDLGTAHAIRGISLFGPPESWNLHRFQELDVRVGNSSPTGNFSSYQQLGYMSGIAPRTNYEFTIHIPSAITGRYVSVEKMSGHSSHFQIGHIEIFE